MLAVLAGEDADCTCSLIVTSAVRMVWTILSIAIPISSGDASSLLSCDQSDSDTPGGVCQQHTKTVTVMTIYNKKYSILINIQLLVYSCLMRTYCIQPTHAKY